MVNPEDFTRALLTVIDERLHEAAEAGATSLFSSGC
jgi:hypothetical protein